ncbi:MAG: phage protein NinX family protein [Burkholderiaceae bacterium]
MNVFDLSGALLDYWVGRAEKLDVFLCQPQPEGGLESAVAIHETGIGGQSFAPSKNWAQGGPIIERERIGISPLPAEATAAGDDSGGGWQASLADAPYPAVARGASILEAAMRLRVAAAFGPSIEEDIDGDQLD